MTMPSANDSGSIPFVLPNIADIAKPYTLMDLDDTLFQTRRKIDSWRMLDATTLAPSAPYTTSIPLTVASVNKSGEPLSFFTKKQAQFFAWLVYHTELIPITARDTQEITRVRLPFDSWQVLTHGAVIKQPDGAVLDTWQAHMAAALIPYQTKLRALIDRLIALDDADLVITPHYEHFGGTAIAGDTSNSIRLLVYVAIKHRDKIAEALTQLADRLPNNCAGFDDDFYIHSNANNLAILPHHVHKKHALAFLQAHCLDMNRPSFGFGDSLADLPFLQLLDWYGMPSRGQLHDRVSTLLNPVAF